MSIKRQLQQLEEKLGKGEYQILTHEGFVTGSMETRPVSKQEYDEHMLQLEKLA